MQHRVSALMYHLASECSDSDEGATNLLSSSNLENAIKFDGYETVDVLKCIIYATHKEFGFEHALGVFKETVLESFNNQQ